MVRYLILILSLFFFGCETSGQQLIKPEKLNFNEIKFDAVSKELLFQKPFTTQDEINYGEIIDYWFDNRIKTNGFEGNLVVEVKELQISRIKEDGYYKVETRLLINFREIKENSNKSKFYEVEAFEYGEITGSFSIKDQDNLDINIMYKNLNNISKKLEDIL